MHVLITGGAGFIGSNLSLKLIELGHVVTVFDNLSPQVHGNNPEHSKLYLSIKDKVNFINGTIESKTDWLTALSYGAEVIVHLAADTGTGQSMYEIKRYSDTNITGSAILLDILANEKLNLNKIIVASSRAIYGEGKYRCIMHGIVYPDARKEIDMQKGAFNVKCPHCGADVELLATDEDSKIHPSSIYGVTKQVQEQMFFIGGRSLGIDTISLRFQNVYGVGQSLSNPYTGILSVFSTRIKNNNDLVIYEDGKESRDFIYIDDVVNAICLAIESDEAAVGRAYNVGSGICTDLLTVAHILKKKYHSDVNVIVSGNYRLGDIRHNYADLTKIKKFLNFEPKVSFEQGISKFIDWVNSQHIENDLYENSIHEMKIKGLYK